MRWKSALWVIVLIIGLGTQLSHADEAQIKSLYQRVGQDIALEVSRVETLLSEYQTRHAGQEWDIVTRGASSGFAAATGRKDIQEHLTALKAIAKAHAENAELSTEIDDWIGKMRGWAIANLRASVRHSWQAQIYATDAEIARVKHLAKDICASASDVAFEGEDPGSAIKYYENEAKFGPMASKTVAKRLKKVQRDYERLRAEYQAISQGFATERADRIRQAWRWVHYFEGLGLDQVSGAYRVFLFKRFGYANRNRPEFRGNSFYESDLNWYISFPFSEDRFFANCGVTAYAQSESYDFFVKLDKDSSTPAETYDTSSERLEPLSFSGSVLEQIAKLLSARTVEFYDLKAKLKRHTQQVTRLTKQVEEAVALRAAFERLVQMAVLEREKVEGGATLSDRIAELEAERTEQQNQIKLLQQQIAEEQDKIDAANAPRQGVRIMPDGAGGWRAPSESEHGLDAETQLTSLLKRLPNFDQAIQALRAIQPDYTDPDYRKDQARRAQDIRRLEREKANVERQIAQIKQLQQPPSAADTTRLDSLKQELDEAQKSLQATDQTLARLKALIPEYRGENTDPEDPNALPSDFGSPGYDKLRVLYASTLTRLKAKLTDEEALNRLDEQLPGARADPALIRTVLDQFLAQRETLTSRLDARVDTYAKPLRQALRETARLNRRQTLLTQSITRLRGAAANLIGPELVSAGARNNDAVVEFMTVTKKAMDDAKGVIEALTSLEKGVETGLGLAGSEEVERQTAAKIVDLSNKVRQSEWVQGVLGSTDLPGSSYFAGLQEHVETTKKATEIIVLIGAVSELDVTFGSAPTSDEEQTLEDAFGYLKNIVKAAELMKNGFPVGGDIAGYYLDFISKSVNSIEAQALSVQKRALGDTIKFELSVPPERRLYTAADVKKFNNINWSDRPRALRVLQARRLIALMSARNRNQACEQSTTGNRCVN